MIFSKFSNLKLFSTAEILRSIVKTEHYLVGLYIKKSTKQRFKSHTIKSTKHNLARLKTVLALKLKKTKNNNN